MLGFVYASSSVKETVHYLKIVRAIKSRLFGDVKFSLYIHMYIRMYIHT